MPSADDTAAPAHRTWLVWCQGRPHLNRLHASRPAADRDARDLAAAYPNHRFDIYELIASHSRSVPYGATRGTPNPRAAGRSEHF